MKKIMVGTLESSDCLITLSPSKTCVITITSVVYDTYGDQIETVVRAVLKAQKLNQVHVDVQDKGALDYAIKARLETAIKRFKEAYDES